MDNNDDILTNKKNNTEDKAKSVTSQCDCHKSKEASRNKEDPLQRQVERRETLSPTSIVDIIPMGSIALTKQQDDDEEDVASYTQMLYVQSNGSTLSLKGDEREHDLSSSSSRLVTEEQLTDLSVDKVALSIYRLRRQQQQQQLQNRRQQRSRSRQEPLQVGSVLACHLESTIGCIPARVRPLGGGRFRLDPLDHVIDHGNHHSMITTTAVATTSSNCNPTRRGKEEESLCQQSKEKDDKEKNVSCWNSPIALDNKSQESDNEEDDNWEDNNNNDDDDDDDWWSFMDKKKKNSSCFDAASIFRSREMNHENGLDAMIPFWNPSPLCGLAEI